MRIGFAPSGLPLQGSDRIVGLVSMGTEVADSKARRREPAAIVAEGPLTPGLGAYLFRQMPSCAAWRRA